MLSSTNTYNYYWKLLWKRQSGWHVNTQGLCLSILIPQSPLPSVSGSSFAKQNLRPTSLGSEKRGRAGLGCTENAHQMLVDFCLRESLQRTAKALWRQGPWPHAFLVFLKSQQRHFMIIQFDQFNRYTSVSGLSQEPTRALTTKSGSGVRLHILATASVTSGKLFKPLCAWGPVFVKC